MYLTEEARANIMFFRKGGKYSAKGERVPVAKARESAG